MKRVLGVSIVAIVNVPVFTLIASRPAAFTFA